MISSLIRFVSPLSRGKLHRRKLTESDMKRQCVGLRDSMLLSLQRISIKRIYRDYIEAAREYFKDKGWEYEPEREEIADKALNDRLQDIQSIVIEYGGYFGGTEKRTITFEGEKILVEKEYTLRILSPEELQQNPAEEFHDMEKAEFLEEFADLHLGEWEKEYEDLNVLDGTQWSVVIKFSSGKAFKSYGSNRFPYNFSGFLDLVRISESDM